MATSNTYGALVANGAPISSDIMITQDGLFDTMVSFDEDHNNGKQDTLIIKREQFIPKWHMDNLLSEKLDSFHTPTGDFYRVASVPMHTVEKWQREGFNIFEGASAREIIDRLNKEQLDAFITTRKRI